MFIKKVRIGTRGVGVAQPVYKEVVDWGAVAGAAVLGLIVLAVISSLGG